MTSTSDGAERSGGEQRRGGDGSPRRRQVGLTSRTGRLIRAIRDGDDAMVEEGVLNLSQSRRLFAPLALVVGAFTMIFGGVRLLFSNWRLTLIQVLPAMWIWLVTLDLKLHVLHGKSIHVVRGPVRIPIVLAVAAITTASFFLNAVFAFAIAGSRPPKIPPAFREARAHLAVILGWGAAVGLPLGLSTAVAARWGRWWFSLSLSIVLAVMMVCYVAVPSRLIGVKTSASKRDRLTTTAVGGALGAVVCTPPYLLGRIGILMLGARLLFIPGIFVLTLGVTAQAGATGAVKAIKMSVKLAVGRSPAANRQTL